MMNLRLKPYDYVKFIYFFFFINQVIICNIQCHKKSKNNTCTHILHLLFIVLITLMPYYILKSHFPYNSALCNCI